jgi:hypothetical protein
VYPERQKLNMLEFSITETHNKHRARERGEATRAAHCHWDVGWTGESAMRHKTGADTLVEIWVRGGVRMG